MRELAARAEGVAQCVDEARRPCRSPGPHLRGATPAASGSVPRGPCRRRRPSAATRPTVRMTPSAVDSANGFGLAERSDSSEWVMASMPVAAVDGRRQPDGQRRVEDRGDREQGRMADVALAAGRLVGDHAERIRLGAGPGGRRNGDEGTTGGQRRAVVVELPDGQRVVGGPQVERLGGVHRRAAADRHDDRALEAEGAAAPPRHARRSRRPGSARPRRTSPVSRPASASTARTRSTTPERRTPGSVTTNTREPPAAATSSGSRAIAPTPKYDPVAQHDLDLAIGEAGHGSDLDDLGRSLVSRRTVSQRRQPAAWNQRSVVTPSGLSNTQTSSKSRSSGSVDRRRARDVARRRTRTRRAAGGRSAGSRARASARPRRALVGQRVVAPEAIERERRDQGRRAGPWRSARPSPRRRPGSP